MGEGCNCERVKEWERGEAADLKRMGERCASEGMHEKTDACEGKARTGEKRCPAEGGEARDEGDDNEGNNGTAKQVCASLQLTEISNDECDEREQICALVHALESFAIRTPSSRREEGQRRHESRHHQPGCM